MSETKHFKIGKVEKLPDWEAEVVGEISLEFLSECRKEALKHLQSHANLPGFRKGQVPEDILIKTFGEMHILEETAEVAIGKEYGNIVEESKLRPIARPQISVTKLAPGIPLEFKVRLVLEPEFELPDYKKLASEIAEGPASTREGEPTRGGDAEKKRLKIMEALNKETKLDLPHRFVHAEAHHMMNHFKSDIEKAGITWEDYLKRVEKTEEELVKTWEESVSNRAKSELILAKIAEKENLKTYKEVFEMLEKN